MTPHLSEALVRDRFHATPFLGSVSADHLQSAGYYTVRASGGFGFISGPGLLCRFRAFFYNS